MATIDEIDVYRYVVVAAREYLKDLDVEAELAAYADMGKQMEGVLYLATEAGLCVVRATPLQHEGAEFQGATPELTPWRDVRDFERRVTYGSWKGDHEAEVTLLEVSIKEPPLRLASNSRDNRRRHRQLSEFAIACHRQILHVSAEAR